VSCSIPVRSDVGHELRPPSWVVLNGVKLLNLTGLKLEVVEEAVNWGWVRSRLVSGTFSNKGEEGM